jgi:hypothetical protein
MGIVLGIELDKLPATAQKVLSAGAPPAVRMMAAKGIVPGLKPGEIVTVIAVLSENEDPRVAEAASGTLAQLAPPLLNGALSADLDPGVITKLCPHYAENADFVGRILRMPRLGLQALELLAELATESIGELIATNEELMLQSPTVIEKLYMNKRVRMSTADRLLELAVRNNLELGIPAFKEAAQAIKNELIMEAGPEPTPDDQLFVAVDQIAEQVQVASEKEEDTHEVSEEGEEQVREKFVPLYAQIANMTPTQKIRRAQVGNAVERMLLVRDSNRLVAVAAVKRMQENEATIVSMSRQVIDDVLKEIARSPEFKGNYQIKLNLVMNPRTPLTFAMRLIPMLRESDLRQLARSKNIAGSVAQSIRNQLERKRR